MRKRARLPQVDEVAQGADRPQGEGLPAVVCVGVAAADGDGEGPLAEEGLVSGGQRSQVIHHHEHLHHRLVGVE